LKPLAVADFVTCAAVDPPISGSQNWFNASAAVIGREPGEGMKPAMAKPSTEMVRMDVMSSSIDKYRKTLSRTR